MLAIQSGIAKYHCLYTQGAVAFQTVRFLTHPVFAQSSLFDDPNRDAVLEVLLWKDCLLFAIQIVIKYVQKANVDF